VVERYDYNPYGGVNIFDGDYSDTRAETEVHLHFLYTGQMYDAETGLHHYKRRGLQTTLGRFLQRDPIGYSDGMLLYAYVGNRSATLTDPTGREIPTGDWVDAPVPDEYKKDRRALEKKALGVYKYLLRARATLQKLQQMQTTATKNGDLSSAQAGALRRVITSLRNEADSLQARINWYRYLHWNIGNDDIVADQFVYKVTLQGDFGAFAKVLAKVVRMVKPKVTIRDPVEKSIECKALEKLAGKAKANLKIETSYAAFTAEGLLEISKALQDNRFATHAADAHILLERLEGHGYDTVYSSSWASKADQYIPFARTKWLHIKVDVAEELEEDLEVVRN